MAIALHMNRFQHAIVTEGGVPDLSEKLLHLNSDVVSQLMM
jgi:hypothetical protein